MRVPAGRPSTVAGGDGGGMGSLGPPPARVHPDALLGPSSVAARLLGHPGILLGGPRALLLQVAHPLVAAGVADHSGFKADPFARLVRTVSAMGTIAFAGPGPAGEAAAAVAATHRRVRGRAPDGRAYAAGDPRLAAWVHATLVDTALAVDRRWLGLLAGDDRRRFYGETLALGRAFGVPEDGLPTSLVDFEAWFAQQVTALDVGDQALALAREVLHPPLQAAWGAWARPVEAPLWSGMAAVTAELLPPRLRRAYQLPEPGGAAVAALGGVAGLCRVTAPLVPGSLRRPDTPTRLAAAVTGRRAAAVTGRRARRTGP